MKKTPAIALVSIPDFAKQCRVSGTAVRKWIDQGKLKGATRKIGRRVFIDPAKAAEVLPSRSIREPPAKKKGPRKKQGIPRKKTGPKPKRSPSFREKMQEVQGTDAEEMTLTEARVINERFKARLTELQVKEKEGTLIPADETLRAVGDLFRVVRDAMLNIPPRLSPMLAGLKAKEIERRMTEEIDTILKDLSNGIASRFDGVESRGGDRGVAST